MSQYHHAQLAVVLVQSDSNFVSLPVNFAKSLKGSAQGVAALRLGWLSPPSTSSSGPIPSEAFVGWAGRISDSQGIEVPSALAKCIGLSDAVFEAVATTPNIPLIASVSLVRVAPIASRVDIEPLTFEDWEVIEHNAQFVETELLNQICVLSTGQVFPIWVQHVQIHFKVTSVGSDRELGSDSGSHEQKNCVRLARDSQVVVSPKLRPVKPPRTVLDMGEDGSASNAVQLRVQKLSPDLENFSAMWIRNGRVCMHPQTFNSIRHAGNWPAVQVVSPETAKCTSLPELCEGVVTRRIEEEFDGPDSESNQPFVAWLSAARVDFSAKVDSPPGHFSPVGLHLSNLVAPGHVMVPDDLARRCGLEVLGKCFLVPTCYAPIGVLPNGSPSGRADAKIKLHPVVWTAEGAGGDSDTQSLDIPGTQVPAVSIQRLREQLQEWSDQSKERVQCREGLLVPLIDGGVLTLAVGSDGEAEQMKAFRVSLESVFLKEMETSASSPQDEREEQSYVLVDLAKCNTATFSLGSAAHIGVQGSRSGEPDAVEMVSCWQHTGEQQQTGEDLSLDSLGAVGENADQITSKLSSILSRADSTKRVILGTPQPGAVYLCGEKGAGKSSLARAIGFQFRQDQNSLANTVIVHCKLLKGGKRSHVQQMFVNAFRKAITNAPSLLIFDDLDVLLPADSGNPDSAEDAQTVWLAEWIEEQIRSYREFIGASEDHALSMLQRDPKALQKHEWNTKSVAWIATGNNKRSLRSSLLASGLFDSTIEIPPLTAHARCDVLQAIVQRHLHQVNRHVPRRVQFALDPKTDLDEFASTSEGYQPADLAMLTARAFHACVARVLGEALGGAGPRGPSHYAIFHAAQASADCEPPRTARLTNDDFQRATEDFTPASLQGAALTKSDVRWSDVGGLLEVRSVLKDTLELPMQFAPLFERSPQKLASGILLYGPPGCGKTLLAGAVAHECGLNFISVKGPEVLNKYIGASEQAVRDLFARGAAAAPCVLFFDEFDAVAPRRGNDSSGVTDRVVNQLLTFLDGVESRSGVYVMAATSRPDLVDPALLRPGRLDKQLMCGFPSAKEREDILRTIAAKMTLSEAAEEELEAVARLPEAELFTGADLQAILYSAQLDSIHRQLPAEGKPREGESQGGEEETKASGTKNASNLIEPEHIRRAVANTRASVSKEERERYLRIYKAFLGGRGADFEAVSGYDDGKQRTALK